MQKFMEDKLSKERKYEIQMAFNRVRKEFRNEKLLMIFLLNFIFLEKEISLENISFI